MSGPSRMSIGPANKRLNDALDTYVDVTPTSTNVETLRQQLNTLTFTLRNMENALSIVNNATDKWNDLIQRLEGDAQTKENETFENFATATRFLETRDAASETVETLRIRQTEFETAIANAHVPPTTRATTTATSTTDNIRLPLLRLPSFNGDATTYADFWAIFSTTVHAANIDDAQKFAYLSSCLRGPAAELIAGFSITAANYSIAVNLLQEHYGSKSRVIAALFTQLRELPPCSGDATSVRAFYNALERLCRQLEQHNEVVDTPLTVNMIEAKLPRSVMMEILRAKQTEPQWNLTNLRNTIRQIVSLREAMAAFDTHSPGARQQQYSRPAPPAFRPQQRQLNTSFSSHQRSPAPPPLPRSPPTAAFQVGEHQRSSQTPQNNSCRLCHGNHRVFDCNVYSTPQQRSSAAHSQRLCVNCLSRNHRTSDCTSHGCTRCNQRHHTALCFATTRNHNNARPQTPAPRQQQHQQQHQQQRTFSRGRSRPAPQPSANFTPLPTQSTALVASAPAQIQPSLLAADTTTPINRRPGFLPPTDNYADNNVTSLNVSSLEATSILGTIPVIISWNGQCKTVYAVLDSGSEKTFISESVADELQLLSKGTNVLQLQVCGATTPQQHLSHAVTVPIECVDGSSYSLQANTLSVLSQPLQHIPASSEQQRPICVQPDLLIGVDHVLQLIIWQEPTRLDSGFQLLQTRLGPALMGRGGVTPNPTATATTITTMMATEAADTRQQLARLWTLDSIGITDNALANNDDERALQLFQESVTFKDGRYSVRWPWRDIERTLPSNYKIALSRLHSTYTAALNDDYLTTYNDVIVDQLQRGVIEPVNDPWNSIGILHYLPHFAVISPGKSTKCRVVYDAACKATKTTPSLNDLIYAGPALLPGLADILLRFRLPKIAMLSDLEKAFLQISLDERDRDSVRFLWLKDINLPPTPDNIQTFRFARIAFGVVASPFILAATIRYHLQQHPTPLAAELLQNTYVDNIFLSANSSDEAVQKYRASKALFNEACMNARDYISNSDDVNNQLDENDKSKEITTGVTKVLGLHWHFRDNDIIVLQIPAIDFEQRVTKRLVLRQIAQLFDPLGLVSPLLVQPKRFLQQLWERQLKWDQPLTESDVDTWHKIMRQWQQQRFVFPRFLDVNQPPTLHCFVDASGAAYGAVVYVRGNNKGQILFSKSRITPINKATIPRLELLAALLGVRATKFVSQALQWPTARKILWTDSSCVLHWVKRRQMHATFVQNRLNEIWAATGFEFRHIPTNDNPADILSRGATPDELLHNDLWLHGPTFIRDNESTWSPDIDVSILDNDQPHIIHSAALQTTTTRDDAPIFNCARYSSWNKAVRVAAYTWRFYRLLRKQADNKGEFSAAELDHAETMLLRENQQRYPATTEQRELMGLKSNASGVLQCTSDRFLNARDYQPLLYLPRDTPTTRLIIQHVHILTLAPRQTACLVLKAGDTPIGELRVTVDDILLQCHKSALFLTRDHVVKVTSQQLCYDTGSCRNDRCSRILPEDTIDEFEGKFNDYPGTTHCTPLCGCWWCGCFHCHSSCVCHRHYAVPTHDHDVYHLFRCPAWQPRAIVRVTSKRDDVIDSHQFDLLPNLHEQWEGITVKIDIPSMPPLPLLSHPFIASSTRAAILDESQLHQLQQLVCETKEDATLFRCKLSEEACQCHDDGELNCQCQTSALAAAFGQHEALLPQSTPTLTLYANDATITAQFHEQSVAHISLQLQDFQVARRQQATTCSIDIIGINGCYNCRTAAEITYQCHSDVATIGHARCENTQFAVQCGPENARQTTHAHFDKATIQADCNLTCGRVSMFQMAGGLNYINHVARPVHENAKITWLQSGDSGIDWTHMIMKLLGVSNVWLIAIVAVGVSPLAVKLARFIWCA